MIELLAVIGCCWIVKILWKSGVLTMNKQKVLAAISEVRNSIGGGVRSNYPDNTADIHAALDDVVAAVSEPGKVLEKSEQTLEEHIIAHLLLREQEKKREELAKRAKNAIKSIEESA